MDRKITLLTAVLAMGMLCATGFAQEQEADSVGFALTTDFYSQYIWRGQQLTDGYVFQPSFSVSFDNFTAGIWGSMDLENVNDSEHEFTEVDYYLDYSGQLTEGIGFSLGVIYYDFPNTDFASTTELYWGLSFDVPLNPSLTVYHDIDEADGYYASLAVGHSFGKIGEIGPDWEIGMDLGASLGYGDSSYNDFYFGVDDSELNDLAVTLSFPVSMQDGWAFSASVSYITLVNDDIRQASGYDNDYVITGLSLSKEF